MSKFNSVSENLSYLHYHYGFCYPCFESQDGTYWINPHNWHSRLNNISHFKDGFKSESDALEYALNIMLAELRKLTFRIRMQETENVVNFSKKMTFDEIEKAREELFPLLDKYCKNTDYSVVCVDMHIAYKNILKCD